MAQDVTVQEAMDRSLELLALLNDEPSKLRTDESALERVSRCAKWAIRSSLTGAKIRMIAVIILAALDTPQTREVLFDALVDPTIDDQFKLSILQAISAHCDQAPIYADLEGRFVRLAAGACVSIGGEKDACQHVIQRSANALMHRYPDAPAILLELWTAYLLEYGAVSGRKSAACSAALEYAYHLKKGQRVSGERIAQRYGISRRLMRLCVRRMLNACEVVEKKNNAQSAYTMEDEG